MNDVHVVVPDGIDDPRRPSGGNVYDRRACRGLAALGWSVHERAVPGRWPRPDAPARAAVAAALARVPSRSLVLVDGLVASVVPEVLEPEADRLRLVAAIARRRGPGTLQRLNHLLQIGDQRPHAVQAGLLGDRLASVGDELPDVMARLSDGRLRALCHTLTYDEG